MKTSLTSKTTQHGLTLVELLVVIVVIGIFTLALLSNSARHDHPIAYQITCINNLKQVGLATRVWEGDNNDKFPAQVSVTNGGSMEFTTGPNVWRTFQVMSNELSTPKVVTCPSDSRRAATNFTAFGNSNVSFFIGVDANEGNPLTILSGDHNITNGMLIRNGLLTLTTNRPSGWTSEVHNKVGNIAFADGSVQQLSIDGLQNAVANTHMETNRLQMPILGR